MKHILTIIFCTYFFISFSQEKKVYLSTQIEALWKSAAILKTPESVLYSKEYNQIFVSNINGNPVEKDNNGFISKLTPEGNIIDLKWITGLDAPKGMAVYKGHLFISDIDRLVEIDINQGKIINTYQVKGSKFLNDVVADRNGDIYISDTQTHIIYKLSESIVSEFIESELIKNPNGLCLLHRDLFVGTNQKIVKINLETLCISDYILNTGAIDGLFCLESKEFIFSDWTGNIYITALGKETKKLIDTTPLNINAADIGYNEVTNSILVPTFFDNRIMSYRLLKE